MRKTHLVMTALCMALMVTFSCSDDQEAAPKKGKGDPISKRPDTGRTEGACGGYFSDYYYGTGYYTYPVKTIDASSISSTGKIYVSAFAHDVPNRFMLKNSSGTTVAWTGWLGCTQNSGPWGGPFCNSASAQFNVTRGSSTSFTLVVETVAPSNMNDAWEASVSCTN